MKILLRLSLLCIALLFGLAPAGQTQQRETLDRIIAVVGDEAILASELGGQLQMYALQTGREPKTQEEFDTLRDDILDQMITDRLFLIEARKDTAISIRPEEIEQALDDHVARISSNFNSDEEFLQALALEGMTVRDLRRKYRSEVENQLLKQKFIQRKLYDVSVSRKEVEEFYREFKDSIPAQPEGIKLAHILVTVEASEEIEDSVQAYASELRQRVLDGADFASLSARHSSYGAGENGGDLGFISRDDVVPEFARAAFNLNVGDISGVIRTQFGLRHILLGVEPSASDSTAAYQLVDSLIQVAREGEDFGELAKKFSSDNETRAQGGELGWFAIDRLPEDFAVAVAGWQEPGEVRGPVTTEFGLHILKLLDYQEGRQYTLENDYDRLKELARQDKTGRVVDDWIAEIKETTYIEYRLES